MILSSIPIRTVDLLGSVLMIIFSFLCLGLVRELRRRDRNNVIWIYLLLVCIGFALMPLEDRDTMIGRIAEGMKARFPLWCQ